MKTQDNDFEKDYNEAIQDFRKEESDLIDYIDSTQQKENNENNIDQLIKSGKYKRNEKEKTLGFFYNITEGDKRDVEIYIKEEGNKIKVIIDVYNTLGRNRKEEDKVMIFDKKEITNIPEAILNTFKTGIEFATLTGNENLKVKNQGLLDKILIKAEGGTKLFEYYTKQEK